MDILNFIYLKTKELIKPTINNVNEDIIPLGAYLGPVKKGDSYLTYGMTIQNFANAISAFLPVNNTGFVTQTGSSGNPVTLNTLSGIITTVSLTNLPNTSITFQLFNSNITTNSVFLASINYTDAGLTGTPVVRTETGNGVTKITITNVDPAISLNNVAKIHFTIIN
jgi:hypothetical protein